MRLKLLGHKTMPLSQIDAVNNSSGNIGSGNMEAMAPLKFKASP